MVNTYLPPEVAIVCVADVEGFGGECVRLDLHICTRDLSIKNNKVNKHAGS